MTSPTDGRDLHGAPPGRRWSVRFLLVWLVLACLLPGIIGAGMLFLHEYKDRLARLGKDTGLTARALSQTVDTYLLKTQVVGETLATDAALARGDFARFRQRAEEVLGRTKVGTNIILVDENAHQLVNVQHRHGQHLVHSPDPEAIRLVFEGGRPLVSEVVIGPLTQRPVLTIYVPVAIEGRVTYVIGVCILAEQFNDILRAQDLPAEWVAAIFDGRGTIIARSGSAEPAAGRPGGDDSSEWGGDVPEEIMQSSRREGLPAFSAYSRSAVTKWSVGIGIPRQALQEQLVESIGLLALGVACLFGLGLAMAWLLGEKIAHSVLALKAQAHALGRGEPVPASVIPIAEAQEVASAMAEAAETLADRAAAVQAAEQSLGCKEEELMRAHRLGKFGLWQWDLMTGEVTASDSIREIYGRDVPAFAEQRGTLLTVASWERVDEATRAAVRSGEGYDLELEAVHGNGSTIWVHALCEPVKDAGGKVIALRGTIQDITERKKAEVRLRQTEAHFRQLAEMLPQQVWVCTPDGTPEYFSPQWLAYSGLTWAQCLEQGWLQAVHPDDCRKVEEAWRAAVDTAETYEAEFRMRRHDGVYRWFSSRGRPLRNERGEVVKWFGANTDIDEPKQLTEALRLTNERFEAALKGASVIVSNQDLELRYTWIYDPRRENAAPAVIGKRDVDLCERPQDAERLEAVKREVIDSGRGLRREITIAYRSGFATFDLVVEPLCDSRGKVAGVTCAAIDITERKRAEEALRRSKEHLRLTLDAAQMVTFDHDFASDRVVSEGQTARSLGIDPAGSGADFFKRLHPGDRARLLATLEGLTPESPNYQIEYRLRGTDDSYRWLSCHGRGIFDEAGRFVGAQGVVADITADKEVALALSNERELLSAIIENIPVMLCVYDDKLQRFRVNRHLEQVLGWTTDDANEGGFVANNFPWPNQRANLAEFMQQPSSGWHEFNNTAKDGSSVACEWATVALSDGSRVGIGIDLRERKEAQAQLALHAERQALLHDVASGILQAWGDKVDMAGAIFRKVSGLLQADYCFNYQILPDKRLQLVAAWGMPEEMAAELQCVSVGQGFSGTAAATGANLVVDRELMGSGELGALARRLGIRAYMVHPLLGLDGRVIGTLSVGSSCRDRFEPEEVDLLQTIAYFLSLAWERQRAEGEIMRLNADLERRVEERTSELVAANRELEGFTFATSHDLRGPLGRINSFSTLLEKQYRDRLEGDGLVFLDFIRQNANRLVRLVDDLLSHARITQQQPELLPVDMPAMIQALLEESGEEIRQAGAEIRLELPPAQVLGDPHALSQALGNLLQNALKYSATARPPAIEIGGQKEEGHFRLWVRDNGIGFDMAYHDRIFEIFRRLHTYSEYEGSGVGLALVKRAMERMGGRVWAESAPGRGATFFLELRAAD